MSVNNIQPFVGVCGVQDTTELLYLNRQASNILRGTGRFLMAGVKRVQTGVHPNAVSDLVRVFIHCDFKNGERFEDVIEHSLSQARPYVSGLQLNVLPWMEIDYAPLFRRLKENYPHVALILQAHRLIMEKYSPRQIADRLLGLPVDYVLFDASQSRGVPYNLGVMGRYVDAVYLSQKPIGVVVAGGLGGQNMHDLFGPLTRTYPQLSCDAFARLNDAATQRLSLPAVDEYLTAWRESTMPRSYLCQRSA